MNVIVDTCIWSLALRRQDYIRNPAVLELEYLIKELRIRIIGAIRQEILSDIRSASQFKILKENLRCFPDTPPTTEDYENAAEFFNLCRSKGVQGSNTDFLICAVAIRNNFSIYTADKDFQLFSKYIPITLHQKSIITSD